jgi:tRNA threonylcarbamoyladenosine biosynthesis protein TsaB
VKTLALETSAKSVSVAVTEDGRVLASSYQNIGLTHSVTLMPLLDGMLQNAGLALSDMDLLAVAAGPGSFTGLRIGVSALKGLAWAEDKPCCGVSTLEAMAQNGRLFEGTVICAMDARRSQVYNALFRCEGGQLTRLCPDRAIGLEELAQELKEDENPKLAVGDGAHLCRDYLNSHGIPCRLAPENGLYQSAVGVALVAEDMARRGETVSGRDLAPTYLRLSQAERERLEKGLKITLD